MLVKALMEWSSRSDLVTQQDPEEEKIDRQTDRHGGGTKSQDNSGEATSKDSSCGVWERGQAGDPGDALAPAFHSAPPGVLETGGAFPSPVKMAGGHPVPFLRFSLLSRCLVPSPPQLSDSAKASTVLARPFSSPLPHN